MTDTAPTYRQALKDSQHPLYKAAWIIFGEKMNLKFAAKELEAQKEQVIPFLMEIANTSELESESSLGSGHAPPNALRLLGRWRVVEALPRLLHILEHDDWDTNIHEAAVTALEKMGPAALEPVLAIAEKATESADRITLASILSFAGKGDPRAYAFIKTLFDEQKTDWDIRFVSESLLACDRDAAIALLEERIRRGKYNKALRKILEGYIADARSGEFDRDDDD
jgi:hypothetical protein